MLYDTAAVHFCNEYVPIGDMNMKFEVGKAPILMQGQIVMVTIPGEVDVRCTIIGMTSNDMIWPVYIVECTDGTFPNEAYHYKAFTIPLSEIETIGD